MIRRATAFALATVIVTSGYMVAQVLMGRLLVSSSGAATGNEIVLTLDSSCPSGTAEVSALSTKMLRGTLAATGNVGTSAGSDSITPTGTNSAPTFTGDALSTHTHGAGSFSAAAQTFTGSSGTVPAETISYPANVPTFSGTPFSSVINHTHTINVTDPGHTHVQNVNSATTGPLNGYGVDTSTNTSSASGYSTASATTGITATSSNPAGGVASITPAGTVAWPANPPTNGTVSFTPAGTNGSSSVSGTSAATSAGTPTGTNSAPTFTGDAFDNRPAYTNVIFCQRALVPQPNATSAMLMLGGSLWGFTKLRRTA